MKKLVLTTLIAAGLGMAAQGTLAAAPASTGQGEVHFTGKVVSNTCVITEDKTGVREVSLVTVPTSALNEAGKTAGYKSFDLEITGCEWTSGEGSSKVLAHFENTNQYVDANGRLKNLNASGAKYVVIELTDKNAQPINVITNSNNDADANYVTIESDGTTPNPKGKAKLTYGARYYATGAAEAGDVLAKVKYTLAYK
ncbi:fimbrial protein [Gallibacterium salpingitidis]|uniref:Fimbrial-type adhesion domain-containing protein n=1 Tax=Gallibacterium salpingitidis TaxID=505341 RepID=A0A1A7NV83_9PAST|nr:fimbrial protein [Gallibacterium salpingitidis]OBW94117.1 hypothetical protein QS62_06700 [Gallibacterium salpingitidis]